MDKNRTDIIILQYLFKDDNFAIRNTNYNDTKNRT